MNEFYLGGYVGWDGDDPVQEWKDEEDVGGRRQAEDPIKRTDSPPVTITSSSSHFARF
jgi:hypothetical protein